MDDRERKHREDKRELAKGILVSVEELNRARALLKESQNALLDVARGARLARAGARLVLSKLDTYFRETTAIAIPPAPWRVFPARQLTGKPYAYHAYVGRAKPELLCCGRHHRRAEAAEQCALRKAQRHNRGAAQLSPEATQ